MKINQPNLALAVLASLCLAAPGVRGADVVKTNNLDNLNLGSSWVGGTAPTVADTAVFDSTYATTGTLNVGALVQWAGLRVTSPGGAVLINNSTSPNNIGIGAGGLDLSSAATNLVIRRFQMDASQTWDIAAGRTFRIGSPNATFAPAANDAANNRVGVFVNNSAGATLTKNGAGIVYLDLGNTSLGNVNWQINAGTVAAIWNTANAFGTGIITLAGGGVADGTPVAGSLGNWTWNNPITLQAATSSFIDNQNTGGSGRWLKLESPIGGSGNLEFRDTGVSFDNLNNGFILAGSNTMSGTLTIAAAAEVRVGGSAPGGLNASAGTYGTLGTATIINNGWLTFSRTDAYDVTNDISGTGSVRIGSESLAGTDAQYVTAHGAWTYSGSTLINRGTLALAPGSSLPNTVEIYLNAPNVEATTLDVTALGSYTLGSGRRLLGRGTTGANIVNGNFVAASGSTLVPGGSNTVNTLTFNNDVTLNGATLLMDVTSASWDHIQVNGNFSASGVTTIQCVAAGGLTTGEYPLIQIAGTRGGSAANFNLTGLTSSGTRQSFSLAYGTATYPNDIVLVVSGSAPANLTWKGDGTANVWDVDGALNWDNLGTPDKFFNNDAVTFDDTGSTTPAVSLVGTLLPSSVTDYSTMDRTFNGSGVIGGVATLTKSGSGTLTLANTNTYTGVTTVSGGTLVVASGAAITDTGSVAVDTGGAAFQVNASETIATLNNVSGSAVNVSAGTLSYTNGSLLGSLTGTGTLARFGTTDTAQGQFTAADALAFNGTLVLRGSTPSLNPGSLQGASGRFWLHDINGSQLAGTKFNLDTGASISNAQDVIIGDWDANSGNRLLTLASLTGYGSLRSDAGGDGARHIIVDQATDTTFSGMILAHASTHATPFLRGVLFEKLGSGTLTMANVMGRQTASAASATNASYTVLVEGGKLVMLATNTIEGSITVAGGATLEVGGAGLLGNGTYAYAMTNDGTLTVNSAANQTLAGGIAGAGTLTKSGSGTLSLAGTNTFTGATTVGGGALVGVTGGAVASAVTVADGATNGVRVLAAGGQWTCGGLTFDSGTTYADFDFGAQPASPGTAPLQVNGNLTLNGTLNVIVRNGVFAPGTYPLIKYTGTLAGTPPTTVFSLPAGMSATLVNNPGNQSIDLNVTVGNVLTWGVGDGLWDINTTVNWINNATPVAYNDGQAVAFDDTASGPSPITVTLNTNVQPAAVVVSNPTKDYTLTGPGAIGGGTALTKQGAGRLTLATANTYTGGTVINAGAVEVQNPGALGTGAVVINSGATLQMEGGLTLANGALTLASTGAGNTGGLRSLAGTNTTASTVALAAAAAVGVTADQLTLSGVISGTNSLVKVGDGKLVLGSANNSFTGDFTLAGGSVDTGTTQGGGVNGYLGAVNGSRTIMVQTGATLNFLSNNQFGGGGKTALDIPSVVLDGGTLNSTRFNILGNVTLNNGATLTQSTTDAGNYEGYEFLGGTVTVGGTGTATIGSGNGRLNHLAGNLSTTFAVGNTTGDAAADLVVSNGLRDGSGDNVGAGGLTKTGAGTMLLAGADSYTGDTLVNEGTLAITTARTGAGSFTVADGATLVVSNAGNAASAPMSFLNLGASGTATLAFAHVASPTVPLLNVPGGLYVNGANTIQIADATGLTATGVYPLVAYGATLSGSVPALAPLPAGVTATLTNDTVNGWIALAVTAVPSAVDANPTNVLASVSGNNLVLSWPASHTGWTLQVQTNSLATGLSNDTNAWFDVPGSTLTNQVSLPVDQVNPAVFYRLRLAQ